MTNPSEQREPAETQYDGVNRIITVDGSWEDLDRELGFYVASDERRSGFYLRMLRSAVDKGLLDGQRYMINADTSFDTSDEAMQRLLESKGE